MTSTSSAAKKTEQLLQQTRLRFPRFDDEEVEITPIEKGGSDRRFYRVRSSPEHRLILVKYNLERSENRQYVQVAEFLAAHDIRAPKVFFHDPVEGLIWIEDLGETDLWSYRDEEWPVRRPLYESALEEIAKLHCLPTSAADAIRSGLPVEFDAALYRWEQQYFFENCLGRYFGVEEKLRAQLAALPVLQQIAERLESRARVLVHRDFQSQNIIIRDEQAYLIDFQGMRPGLSKYDLASLLYDPYVRLSAAERSELFEIYRALRQRAGSPLRDDSEEIFRLCAMQRLMQALGAYGYLGLVRGNTAFLEHIPAAVESLRSVLGQIEGTEELQAALAEVGGKNPFE
ncbi:MAG TPA: phosphotransferase [Chthoniobacterales bacterium]|nr:phosphotransferase [Chthoniobacterales bacterium]